MYLKHSRGQGVTMSTSPVCSKTKITTVYEFSFFFRKGRRDETSCRVKTLIPFLNYRMGKDEIPRVL